MEKEVRLTMYWYFEQKMDMIIVSYMQYCYKILSIVG